MISAGEKTYSFNRFFVADSSVQELPVNTDWLRRSARGESLKIPASPSVTTLSFRSHMFLKKRGGGTECNHNIFFSAPSWLCVPQKWPFPGCWSTMSWESEVKWSDPVGSLRMATWLRWHEPGKQFEVHINSYTVFINGLLFLLCAVNKSQTNLGSGVRHRHLKSANGPLRSLLGRKHGRSKCLLQEKRKTSHKMSSWHRWPQIPF